MGRRQRQRADRGLGGRADSSEYTDDEGNVLVLRGSLSPRTRRSYARIASGQDLPPAATRDDAWQRSFEFLFEHLAESWTIAGTDPLTSQRELLGRLRMASQAERGWVRNTLRRHCDQYFPELA
jgi:hypothetical protein